MASKEKKKEDITDSNGSADDEVELKKTKENTNINIPQYVNVER